MEKINEAALRYANRLSIMTVRDGAHGNEQWHGRRGFGFQGESIVYHFLHGRP